MRTKKRGSTYFEIGTDIVGFTILVPALPAKGLFGIFNKWRNRRRIAQAIESNRDILQYMSNEKESA